MCLRIHSLMYACVAAGLSSETTFSDKYTLVSYLRTTRLNAVHREEVGEGGDFAGSGRKSPSLYNLSAKPHGTEE